MITLSPEPLSVVLEDCPIGLFLHKGQLCLKTEYRGSGPDCSMIDAYIVSSGEFFAGPQPQTTDSQRRTLVTPVKVLRGHRWAQQQS